MIVLSSGLSMSLLVGLIDTVQRGGDYGFSAVRLTQYNTKIGILKKEN